MNKIEQPHELIGEHLQYVNYLHNRGHANYHLL